jgi:hypothetical protein
MKASLHAIAEKYLIRLQELSDLKKAVTGLFSGIKTTAFS